VQSDDVTGRKQAAARFPNWLFWYGIAGYLAHMAADAERIHESTFLDAGLTGADSACVANATVDPRHAEVLRIIAAAGVPELFTAEARTTVVPVWFPCTLSMTKFLVEMMGGVKQVGFDPAVRSGWERASSARALP